jgi:hypothetical protein
MHNAASMRGGDEPMQKAGKRIPAPLDEARASLYALPSGQLYIKSESFREAGLMAAKDIRDPTRKGRSNMEKRFASSVFLSQEFCPLYRNSGNNPPIMSTPEPKGLEDRSAEWIIDRRRVVVQKQGILRSRARIDDWMCPLEFEYDEDTIDENLILAVVHQGGKFPGVLDYRVGRKGQFGRYTAELASNGFDFLEAEKAVKKRGRAR